MRRRRARPDSARSCPRSALRTLVRHRAELCVAIALGQGAPIARLSHERVEPSACVAITAIEFVSPPAGATFSCSTVSPATPRRISSRALIEDLAERVDRGIRGPPSGDLDHLLAHGVDDGLHARVQVQLLRMLRMWFFTVFSEMNSCLAMSRLFRPCATSLRTSISRSVSRGAGIGGRSSVALDIAANSFSSFEAIDGEMRDWPAQTLRIASATSSIGISFEQVARRAGLDRVVQVGLVVADREHQDLDVRQQVADLGRRLDARATRHAHVHQHDVGHQILCLLDGLLRRRMPRR